MHGMARVGQGGIAASLGRIMPPSVSARVDRSTWHVPEVLGAVRQLLSLEDADLWGGFGMGLSFVGVVNAEYAEAILAVLGEYDRPARIIGEVVPGNGTVAIS